MVSTPRHSNQDTTHDFKDAQEDEHVQARSSREQEQEGARRGDEW